MKTYGFTVMQNTYNTTYSHLTIKFYGQTHDGEFSQYRHVGSFIWQADKRNNCWYGLRQECANNGRMNDMIVILNRIQKWLDKHGYGWEFPAVIEYLNRAKTVVYCVLDNRIDKLVPYEQYLGTEKLTPYRIMINPPRNDWYLQLGYNEADAENRLWAKLAGKGDYKSVVQHEKMGFTEVYQPRYATNGSSLKLAIQLPY